MSYDPSQDRPPSPLEVGELFVATKELAVVHGTWTLGNPEGDSEPADWDKPTFKQERFFGLPGFAVGGMVEFGEYPAASYPPTHSFEPDNIDALLWEVPDAREVLGIGEASVRVMYHEPYLKIAGTETPQDLAELKPQPVDCVFVLYSPEVPGLARRTYRLTPKEGGAKLARGTRIDVHGKNGVLRGENGLFPDIMHQEWDCLTRLVRCAAELALNTTETEEHTPQEEDGIE